MSYNGWSNYETWAVKLWLDNDPDLYHWQREAANESLAEHSTRAVKGCLADHVKAYVEAHNPLADQASMFTDLLNAALGEVDWYEIAENILSDVAEGEVA